MKIEDVIGSPCKLAILRVLTEGRGVKKSGREIARLSGFSVPSTHEALKDLHAYHIVNLNIAGKQYLYALNEKNRMVLKLIRPIFQIESGLKEEMGGFVIKELKRKGLLDHVVSLILYGSIQQGKATNDSDVDMAVVVNSPTHVQQLEEKLLDISVNFKTYFGLQLDPYVKSAIEFRELFKKGKPPVIGMLKSYAVLYGKEPLEI